MCCRALAYEIARPYMNLTRGRKRFRAIRLHANTKIPQQEYVVIISNGTIGIMVKMYDILT